MQIVDWIETHPVVVALCWPAVTGAVTWIFKPRTPEDYAAMSPRKAAALKFFGATGLDAPNVIESLKQFLRNTHKSAAVYRAERDIPPLPPPPKEPQP